MNPDFYDLYNSKKNHIFSCPFCGLEGEVMQFPKTCIIGFLETFI